jgi:hypothetical protein
MACMRLNPGTAPACALDKTFPSRTVGTQDCRQLRDEDLSGGSKGWRMALVSGFVGMVV